MTDITVQDAQQINVNTMLVDNRLVLLVGTTTIGTVTDEFHLSQRPPQSMTLVVQNLPDGTKVSAQWRISGTTQWYDFGPISGGVSASFAVPSPTAQAAYDFRAEVTEHGLHVDDPKLVLKTRTDADLAVEPSDEALAEC